MFPVFMNLVPISIRQLDTVATHIDSDFREPISRKVQGAPVLLYGQVNLGSKTYEERETGRTGDEIPTIGHLVFEKAVLDAASVILRKGDRVVGIASQATDLMIREVRPESPLNGDFLLIYCELEEDLEKHAGIS